MDLKGIFKQPVTRPIEGVIKADDEASLYTELSEFVLTDEVAKRLDYFLDAYTDYSGANGVWLSGFFGSGKSHLLKMLALLLENRSVEGNAALDIFLPKIHEDDVLLRAKLKKAVAIPSHSILFNIDQKADIISKSEVDALLSVFVKVFNEMCGYYGKQGYIAQFERDLDSRDQLAAFKHAYQSLAGKSWERGREQALLESGNIAKAYAETAGEDASLAKGILDKYRAQYSVSIEDFGNQVKAWLDRKPADFRLNFFVDEVGQYIADNTKLMTNLQTVAESLATKCQGRAWIIVTAQEDMTDVLGDMSKQQSNDFSKIQARFANRLKLTSADVAEVIQKRLLSKNEQGRVLLHDVYDAQQNNFKTLFEFAGGVSYGNFRDEEHFIYSYPFVPYQFPLFQAAIRGLSLHNAFEGKANSVGERSMLGVFRDVAIAIQNEPVGQLATFDRMFEGIRSALKGGIQSAINVAERNLGDAYAVRLLKALFLVKYVKEFKATPRNLSVLMLERFDQDLPAQHKQLQAALDKLEAQSYIQRTGDVYEFLTDEEKDIEEEIKNTEVESTDIAKQLVDLLFDGVIRQRKIRYDNGRDYAYTRKMDERIYNHEAELAIHVISPLSDAFDNLQAQRMQTMGRDELRVVLPADARFMQDLTLYKRTEKYIRQNSSTPQEAVRRILEAKGFQNSDRLAELQTHAGELLGKSTLIVNAGDLGISSSDGATRVIKGFHTLIELTYPNLRMLRRDVNYAEADIGRWLEKGNDGLIGTGAGNLTEPEQELFNAIQGNARAGVRSTVKILLERFERKPYGWPYAAILCNLALLIARGKVEVRQDSNTLEGEALERALRNTAAQASLVLEPQVDFSPSQIRHLKDFFSELFDRPIPVNEPRAMARETKAALQELAGNLAELQALKGDYPFLTALSGAVATLKDFAGKDTTWFFTELPKVSDSLLDMREDLIAPIQQFMGSPQKTIYDQARQLLREEEDNLPYVASAEADAVHAALAEAKPWQGNRLVQLKPQLEVVQRAITDLLAAERSQAAEQFEALSQRLCNMEEHTRISEQQRATLAEAFTNARQDLQGQRRVAMVRDFVRRFEQQTYPSLLANLTTWAKPEPTPTSTPYPSADGVRGPDSRIADAKIIPARDIRVSYAKALLGTEAELDDYLRKQREAWLKEIQAGNRVQI